MEDAKKPPDFRQIQSRFPTLSSYLKLQKAFNHSISTAARFQYAYSYASAGRDQLHHDLLCLRNQVECLLTELAKCGDSLQTIMNRYKEELDSQNLSSAGVRNAGNLTLLPDGRPRREQHEAVSGHDSDATIESDPPDEGGTFEPEVSLFYSLEMIVLVGQAHQYKPEKPKTLHPHALITILLLLLLCWWVYRVKR